MNGNTGGIADDVVLRHSLQKKDNGRAENDFCLIKRKQEICGATPRSKDPIRSVRRCS